MTDKNKANLLIWAFPAVLIYLVFSGRLSLEDIQGMGIQDLIQQKMPELGALIASLLGFVKGRSTLQNLDPHTPDGKSAAGDVKALSVLMDVYKFFTSMNISKEDIEEASAAIHTLVKIVMKIRSGGVTPAQQLDVQLPPLPLTPVK